MLVRTTKPALCRTAIFTLSALASALNLTLLSDHVSASPLSTRSTNEPIIAPKTVATTQSNVVASTDVAPQVSIAPTIPIPYSVPYSVPVPVASGYPYPVPSSTAFSKRWGGGEGCKDSDCGSSGCCGSSSDCGSSDCDDSHHCSHNGDDCKCCC
ncbi:hypothetical protein EDD21DRAFT_388816 [Dissophora ornata]|nr:hypothetical protein EDD21DRAFT_388816 [Dissophora ornata]